MEQKKQEEKQVKKDPVSPAPLTTTTTTTSTILTPRQIKIMKRVERIRLRNEILAARRKRIQNKQ